MESNKSPKSSAVHVCHYVDCLKAFSKPSRLLIHLRTHTGERPFICSAEGCDKSYVRKSHLDRHYDTTHGDQEIKSFVCSEADCNKVFGSSAALNKHFKSAHQELKKYKCPVTDCDKAFNKRHQLRAHSFEHAGVLPFQCDFDGCKRQFKQSSHLLRHKKSHETTYNCDESGCQDTFSKWSQLRKHKSQAHKKFHACNVCGKHFPRPVLLIKHKYCHEKIEKNKQMFKCPYDDCIRKYLHIKNLRAHVRSYHKENKYLCSVDGCQKSFVNRAKFQSHLDKLHNNKCRKDKKYPKKGHRKIPIALKLLKHVVNTESPICEAEEDADRDNQISELKTKSTPSILSDCSNCSSETDNRLTSDNCESTSKKSEHSESDTCKGLSGIVDIRSKQEDCIGNCLKNEIKNNDASQTQTIDFLVDATKDEVRIARMATDDVKINDELIPD